MSPQEFAQKVRIKYPNGVAADGRSYANIPDEELTQKVIAKYPVYAKSVVFPKHEIPTAKESNTLFTGAKDLYGGGEKGIGSRLINDVQQGASDIEKGNVVKGIAKAGLRTAGDIAGTVFAPPAAALEKVTGGKLSQAFSQIQSNIEKGQGLIGAGVNKLTDIPAVQAFALKHPNAAEDFNRVLNLVMAGEEKGKIEPSTVVERTGKQITAVPEAIKTKAANIEIAPFKASFNEPIAKAFQEEGIKAPISAITKSPFVQGSEALASKGIFGKGLAEDVNKSSLEIENKTNSIVEKLKPIKNISDENLGRTIQEGLKEYEDNFKLTEGKIYDQFSKTYGKSNVFGMATKEALATLIKEQGKDYFNGVDSRLTKMLNRVTGSDNPQLKALDKQIQDLKTSGANQKTIAPIEKEYVQLQAKLDKELSFDELKETRSSVGEQLQKEPDNTALKRLYGALSKDMEAAVAKASETPFGDSRDASAIFARESLEKLNRGYQTGKAKIEGRIAQSIEKSNPERIAQNLITRNSADTLKTVREMVGEKRFKEISKTFLRQQFEDSTVRGKFNISKLKENLAKYDKETINEVLSPEQYSALQEGIKRLEKLDTLSESLKPGQKYSQGSQTAFLGNMITSYGGLTSALFSGSPTAFLVALSNIAGQYGLSKLFTTSIGKDLLTKGIKPFKK